VIDQQLIEEQRMTELGQKDTQKAIDKSLSKGLGHTTPGGQKILRTLIDPLVEAIRKLGVNPSGSPKKLGNVLPTLSVRNLDTIAYLSIRCLLDRCTTASSSSSTGAISSLKYNSLAISIGYDLCSEFCYEDWKEENPGLFHVVVKDVKERSASYSHQSTVLHHALNRLELGTEMWPKSQQIAVGSFILEVMASAGFIEFHNEALGRQRAAKVVTLSPALSKLFVEHNEAVVGMSVKFTPLVVPPVDWQSRYGGGYHSLSVRPVSVLKPRGQGPGYWKEVANADMDVVYGAINHLQHTRWKINTDVLEVMEDFWERGISVGKLPDKINDIPLNLPPKPADIDTNPEAKKEWKQRAAGVWNEYKKATARLSSLRILASRVLGEARRLADQPVWLAWQMDFRGRLYPLSHTFSPQGADYVKALFAFDEGKSIHTDEQAEYLAMVGPGHYGFDKVSIQERWTWIKEREDSILRAATDPLSDLWWTDADDPWQFLAWCFEWAGWLSDGPGFVSHLPCPQDGSCNGLQHFAAMMRDTTAAAQVNLSPSEIPSDIYQRVADEVKRLLGEDESPLAKQWLTLGIDRKTVKRQVMTLPYGATQTAFKNYFLLWLAEERAGQHPFGDSPYKECVYLTKIAWKAVHNILDRAMEAMSWLQSVSRVASKSNLPLNWMTPAGLPVQQAYRKTERRRVKTTIAGAVTYMCYSEPLDDISPREQAQGVAPNFVHSMDAAHLMLTVCRAKELGIDGLAMVHDSYATHAADSPALSQALREAFVEMYENNDVLDQFLSDISRGLPEDVAKDLPEPPAKGDFDLSKVLESRFFFS